MARIQKAHFVEGRRISELSILVDLAAEIGLEKASFTATLDAIHGEQTQAHIHKSRTMLSEVGGGGFPTFVLEKEESLLKLDAAAYYGQPDMWREYLYGQV